MKISVIIPCYNAEKHIGRCLESLKIQTIGLDNLDVIIVDDHSDDKTIDLISGFPARVIRNERRMQQGYSRNKALEVVVGEYIAFLDADDWIEPDAFEKAYRAAESGADIVNYAHYPADRKPEGLTVFDNPQKRLEFFIQCKPLRGCWDKIYKASFVKEYGFRFAEGLIDEESLFTIPAYLKAKSIYIMNDYLYHYEMNDSGSTCNAVKYHDHCRDNEKVWLQVYERVKNDGSLKENYDLFEMFFIINFLVLSQALAENRGCPYSENEKASLYHTAKRRFPDFENKVIYQ